MIRINRALRTQPRAGGRSTSYPPDAMTSCCALPMRFHFMEGKMRKGTFFTPRSQRLQPRTQKAATATSTSFAGSSWRWLAKVESAPANSPSQAGALLDRYMADLSLKTELRAGCSHGPCHLQRTAGLPPASLGRKAQPPRLPLDCRQRAPPETHYSRPETLPPYT